MTGEYENATRSAAEPGSRNTIATPRSSRSHAPPAYPTTPGAEDQIGENSPLALDRRLIDDACGDALKVVGRARLWPAVCVRGEFPECPLLACTASELDVRSLSCGLAGSAGWGKIAVRVCPSAVFDHNPGLGLAGPAGRSQASKDAE